MLDPVVTSAAVAGVVSLATTILAKSKCVVECGSNDACCSDRCGCCCCDWCRLGFLDAPLNQERSVTPPRSSDDH
jgi:hypothetical protein